MLFSVVIPVYNGEKYLAECLDSVEVQGFGDFEVVVVDDGSNDDSGRIADQYCLRHEAWRAVHGPNEGLLLARRRGLSHCQGEYVVFLDADDALRADALQVVADEIGRTGADIVSFRYSRRADLSVGDDAPVLSPGLYDGERYGEARAAVLHARMNNMWGKALRRSCIDVDADYSGFARLMMAEDLFQLLPVVDAAKSLARLDDILLYYRPNENGSTAAYRPSYLDDTSRVAERVVRCGERWGMPHAGAEGALQLFVSLGHMLVDTAGAMGRQETAAELSRMSASLARVLPDARECARGLRADNRLCAEAIARGNMPLLRLGTSAFKAGRRALGRSA